MVDENVELEILRRFPGRVVLAEEDGSVHIGRGYAIYRSRDDGVTWDPITTMPRSPLRRVAETSRLASRLLRQELRALARCKDGTYVAANREGVFFGREGDAEMKRSHVEGGDLPVLPPMRITVGPDETVLWGEYTGKMHERAIRIFGSRDRGRSFQVIHTYAPGSVEHVHKLVYDATRNHYWVLFGDLYTKPGIARLSLDLERYEDFVRGAQSYRAVEAFDFGDYLVYGNDTQLEANGLIFLNKDTGSFERVRDFEGSVIYGCQYGSLYAITTSVEPSAFNFSKWSSLWLSRDGRTWKCGYRSQKDFWNARYLQFGSIILPSGRTNRDVIFFSGQALNDIDGETIVARLADDTQL